MLPSRGLVRPGHALRLAHMAAPPSARGFGTAKPRPLGAAAALVGRHPSVLGASPATAAAAASPLRLLRSSRVRRPAASPVAAAAYISFWPFGGSGKTDLPVPDPRDKAVLDRFSQPSAASDTVTASASSAATPPPPPPPPAHESFSATAAAPPPSVSATAADTSGLPFDPAAAGPADMSDLLDGATLLDMSSDRIGYLYTMGLDFGWGPTSMCQWLLEHIHVYTGLPWLAAIAGTALLFRAAIFRPSLSAAEHSAKMQVLRKDPQYSAAAADMQSMALKGGSVGQAKAMEARLVMKRMQEAAEISTWRMLIPMVNVPFGYGMFRLLRAMAALPLPGLESAGILWFTDLTSPDPFFVLPIASASIMFLIMRYNLKYMAPEQQKIMKYVQLVVTPMSLIITARMDALVTFFFFFSSVLQMTQTWLWHQPWLRSWANLPSLESVLGGGKTSAARPRAAAFRLDPNSSWQAPRSVSTGVDAKEKDAIEENLTAAPTTIDLVKKTWASATSKAQSATNDRSSTSKAEDYEARRALEDEDNLARRREADFRYRKMKKSISRSSKAAASDQDAPQKRASKRP